MEEDYKLNKVIERHVVYHKQNERRMDGSAGGAFGAFIETLAKEDYYFSGTSYDEELNVHHIVTNDPEKIVLLSGYIPVESDATSAISKITYLLTLGEKVLFCGTPKQCIDLLRNVQNPENLILIDIIHTGLVDTSVLQSFKKQIEEKNHSRVNDIRFFNKEYSYKYSKRIKLENKKTIYTYSKDNFDTEYLSGSHTTALTDIESNLDKRVGDITIGSYDMGYSRDNFGYTYLSINTAKGDELFKKARKRLVVVLSKDDVNIDRVEKSLCIKKKSQGFKQKIFDTIKPFYFCLRSLKNISHFRFIPICKFIYYNFCRRNTITNFKENGLIYFAPYTAIDIAKSAIIELNGPLEIGVKRVQTSKLETRLWMQPNSKLLVHRKCMFGYGSNVEIYKKALLEVGDLYSNAELTLICGQHIKIGKTSNIAKGATIRDTSGHYISVPGFKINKPVEIGNHTWVCSGATIMPGVMVGDGAIVGSCSFVTRNVPSYSMVQGNPAEEVGRAKYFKM